MLGGSTSALPRPTQQRHGGACLHPRICCGCCHAKLALVCWVLRVVQLYWHMSVSCAGGSGVSCVGCGPCVTYWRHGPCCYLKCGLLDRNLEPYEALVKQLTPLPAAHRVTCCQVRCVVDGESVEPQKSPCAALAVCGCRTWPAGHDVVCVWVWVRARQHLACIVFRGTARGAAAASRWPVMCMIAAACCSGDGCCSVLGDEATLWCGGCLFAAGELDRQTHTDTPEFRPYHATGACMTPVPGGF